MSSEACTRSRRLGAEDRDLRDGDGIMSSARGPQEAGGPSATGRGGAAPADAEDSASCDSAERAATEAAGGGGGGAECAAVPSAAGGGADEAGGAGAGAAAALVVVVGGGAAPGRPLGLLARARDADPARGADGDLPLLLAAGPVREALLRLVGLGGLGALMATRRALRRDVRELAAEVAWREGERVNGDGEAVFRVRPARVAEWAARFPGARALAVSKRGMTPALTVSVATAAGGMQRLEALSLRCCGIGSTGAKSLAAALTAASAKGGLRLVKLDVSYNLIGAEGAAALADAIPACAQLASLDISNNNIGDEGAAALANALPACARLATLNVSGGGIACVGAAGSPQRGIGVVVGGGGVLRSGSGALYDPYCMRMLEMRRMSEDRETRLRRSLFEWLKRERQANVELAAENRERLREGAELAARLVAMARRYEPESAAAAIVLAPSPPAAGGAAADAAAGAPASALLSASLAAAADAAASAAASAASLAQIHLLLQLQPSA